jgi:hypothetical protein
MAVGTVKGMLCEKLKNLSDTSGYAESPIPTVSRVLLVYRALAIHQKTGRIQSKAIYLDILARSTCSQFQLDLGDPAKTGYIPTTYGVFTSIKFTDMKSGR